MVYAVTAVPLIAFGAFQAMRTNSNSPLDWVPGSFPPKATYDEHVSQFGSGDLVLASWPGCTIEEPRLDTLLRTLRTHEAFRAQDGGPCFERVSCGRELIGQLRGGLRPLSLNQAAQRLKGTFVGSDGRQTCVVIALTPSALQRRERLVGLIQQCIEDVCDVSPDHLHLAGPVIDGLAVDRAGRSALDLLALPSAAVVLVLACLCLGSIRAGLIVFGLSVFCQGVTLALVHYSGESMSALLIVLPPLIQVLTVAGGVHLTNYYFDAASDDGPEHAPWEAVRLGWLPCVLSAGTTALGIGSLIPSRLTPVRSFGIYGSLGVLFSALLLLLLVPAMWQSWPPRSLWTRRERPMTEKTAAGCLSAWITRSWKPVLAVSAIAIVVSSWQLKHLKTSVRIETLFPPDSRILSDYRWLEAQVGPLVPIDVVVSAPVDPSASAIQRLERIWAVQEAAAEVSGVGATFSALQFVPALTPAELADPRVAEELLRQWLDHAGPMLTGAGLLVEEEGRESWRMTASVSSLSPLDYSQFLARFQDVVAPELAAATGAPAVEVRYTGIMPLVHGIQRLLMQDLLQSFLGAVLTITIMMTLAQGGIAAGLVAMIPNLFPIILLFGLLGWQGTPLDIGMVMTASVALGIAVDDTLHFLSFYQSGLQQGGTRTQAIGMAYRHCGAAMIQTSIICGLGMLVFGLSEFSPTSRFAWMTSCLIVTALLSDLLVLPALLVSPLGCCFNPGDTCDPGARLLLSPFRSDPDSRRERDALRTA